MNEVILNKLYIISTRMTKAVPFTSFLFSIQYAQDGDGLKLYIFYIRCKNSFGKECHHTVWNKADLYRRYKDQKLELYSGRYVDLLSCTNYFCECRVLEDILKPTQATKIILTKLFPILYTRSSYTCILNQSTYSSNKSYLNFKNHNISYFMTYVCTLGFFVS